MYELTQRTYITPVRPALPTLRTWLMRLKTRRQLRDLDARLLADVGITEAERRRECAKWCWQD